MITRIRKALRRRWRRLLRSFGPSVSSVQGLADAEFLRLLDVPDALAHYADRVVSDWPAIPDEITDLRIDLAKMTDQEIIARADAALANELHPSGVRPALTAAGTIDWSSNPADSREWLLMIHRHGWWPLWGAAYQRTGDEKYARAFVAQMLDWIDRNPMPKYKSEDSSAWRLMETGLRMRVSWLPCFGCFYQSEAFTDAAKLKMLRACYDHGQFLNAFYTNRNHLVRESNGLLSLALCCKEFRDSAQWLESAASRLELELRGQVNADGSHLEMSVGYQWLTVIEFEITYALLRQHGRESAIKDLDTTLRKMYELLAAVIRPDGSFPQLNDGFMLWGADKLADVARQRAWADIEYAATAGESGMRPSFCSRSFPNAGLHVMRSDWTSDAFYLVADTGPYGGPHGHEDKLSFELFACGAPFIVDPGSYTYSSDDPYRSYFVGSQGHNSVLVDGGSQVRRWNPEYMTPAVADVMHGCWYSNSQLDVASGHYDEGYAPFSMLRPQSAVVSRDVIHVRDFIFAKPNYWVIADHLIANGRHDYTFLFHLAPDVVVEELTETAAIVRSDRNGARLLVKALAPGPLAGELVDGWYSEDHHKKCESPVLSFTQSSDGPTHAVWVLYPCNSDADMSAVDASMTFVDEGISVVVSRDQLSEQIRIAAPASADSGSQKSRLEAISIQELG